MTYQRHSIASTAQMQYVYILCIAKMHEGLKTIENYPL